ncbi:MAG TPA: ABC transporter permease [Streptosporangiaceae bacterium]|nr:ABC transporter permease [Streptosporangiaceae bacterium]
MTMTWLTWRQFRAQVIAAAAAAAVLAILLAVTGPHMAHLYDSSGIATCTGVSCGPISNTFGNELPWFDTVIYLVGLGIMFLVPAIVGVFWGAPLVAHEIEARTLPLTWNQSVTKTRWLAVKLGLVGLGSMATAGLLSLMLTWWSSPMDSTLEIPYGHRLLLERLGPVLFATRGVAPLGYAAFAFALGVTAGMLTRRTVSAMAATLGGFAALQFAWAEWIRAHLVPPVTVIVPLNPVSISVLGVKDGFMTLQAAPALTQQGAWILSGQVIDISGHPAQVPAIPACLGTNSAACAASLARLHLRELISYEPASRFWTFQWVETGIFVALALALAATCIWWLVRRIA